MNKIVTGIMMSLSLVSGAQVKSVMPEPPEMPIPPPVFRPRELRENEKPVIVESVREIAAENGLFSRVSATITFTNPNERVFEGELEFPLPEGATVCGYALEINGTLVPGVICGKEEARTAFENEKRKGVDPGLVEHVKGNVWKTRIYPLLHKVPRKARVEYIQPLAAPAGTVVVEKDGDDIFVGEAFAPSVESRADRLRKASQATVWWDASMSRLGRVAADRNLLECLPGKGSYKLVVFRNVIEPARTFDSRASLLQAIDALVYDGGTCLDKVQRAMGPEDFLFTDELDVEAAARRRVRVKKLAKNEKAPSEPHEGRLLATAWAADYIADHAAQAAEKKAEFIALGRRYGVASPVTSLIVLETLEQYKTNMIEPPTSMSFYDEWKKWRASEDDPIAAEKAKSEHRASLLRFWEERVKWWNDPIPPKTTPTSGLFRRAAERVSSAFGGLARSANRSMAAPAEEGAIAEDIAAEEPAPMAASSAPAERSRRAVGVERTASSATIAIAAWNPDTPYLKALAAAKDAYAEYLVQREAHGKAPAFYLDCAGWFFKAKETKLAIRILSNLSEMKLEDAALWRTMGWRLREAGAYEEAIATFRHVLEMRSEEPQSRRDLALVLTEAGKAAKDEIGLSEAACLLHAAAFEPAARRSGRRSNDMQTSVIALEELNGLLAWCAANGVKVDAPAMDAAFRRDLPLALRITLAWDVDETDVDLHVLEPDGEEAFYGHRRTSSGGFVSEDVTTGYGPEEYLRKTADKGVYKILANYFASHQQSLTGAATVTATVYTGWGTDHEKREILSFRLDKPKDKHPIGEIKIDGESPK